MMPEEFDEDRIPDCWPPSEDERPPEWPSGADPGIILRQARWGDWQCLAILDRTAEYNAGIAADGEHHSLAAYASDGGDVDGE